MTREQCVHNLHLVLIKYQTQLEALDKYYVHKINELDEHKKHIENELLQCCEKEIVDCINAFETSIKIETSLETPQSTQNDHNMATIIADGGNSSHINPCPNIPKLTPPNVNNCNSPNPNLAKEGNNAISAFEMEHSRPELAARRKLLNELKGKLVQCSAELIEQKKIGHVLWFVNIIHIMQCLIAYCRQRNLWKTT